MKRRVTNVAVGIVAIAIGLILAPAAVGVTGSPNSCSVKGGGRLAAGDTFGGRATETGEGEDASGHWTHHAPDGSQLQGDVDSASCRADGGGPPEPPNDTEANLADLTGTGTWNGEPALWRVHVEDRGEPTENDFYSIAIFAEDETTLLYSADGFLVGGNIQLLSCRANCR